MGTHTFHTWGRPIACVPFKGAIYLVVTKCLAAGVGTVPCCSSGAANALFSLDRFISCRDDYRASRLLNTVGPFTTRSAASAVVGATANSATVSPAVMAGHLFRKAP